MARAKPDAQLPSEPKKPARKPRTRKAPERPATPALDALKPRSRAFVEAYANPASPTFANATQSIMSVSPAITYGSAKELGARELAKVGGPTSEPIAEVMAAAGFSRAKMVQELAFAASDRTPQVRSSQVRALEIGFKLTGDLGADTTINVDARTALLPASGLSPEALVAALQQAASGLATGTDGGTSG